MQTFWLRRLVLTLLAGTCLSGQAQAQEPSGNVIRVDPAVNAAGPGGQRLLELEGAIFMGDEIVASPQGLAQIRFLDDTKMVIGPNSRLRIDEFVFNPDNSARRVTVSVVKGVFRFISGNGSPGAYNLRTSTLTIGLRGTVVDGYSAVNGDESGAAFLAGGGDVCDSGGSNCVVATDDCTLLVAPRGGGVGEATGLDRDLRMQVRFPFIQGGGQGALDPAFQVDTAVCSTAQSNINAVPQNTIDNEPDGYDE